MAQMADLVTAQREASRRVGAITADQWTLPTPCEGWTVRDLVVHLVEGSHMVVRLLDGATKEEAIGVFGAAHGADLAGELDEGLAAERTAFERPGASDMTVHHPAGDLTGQVLLGFRTGDYLVHSWDLARATGDDEALPAETVGTVWEDLQPMAPIIGTIGAFGSGPSGTVPDDAPLQQRLLDLVGRRP